MLTGFLNLVHSFYKMLIQNSTNFGKSVQITKISKTPAELPHAEFFIIFHKLFVLILHLQNIQNRPNCQN